MDNEIITPIEVPISKIKEIELDNEKIYLKKDYFGWRTVNPIQKDSSIPFYDKINKKCNWNNIYWKNLLFGGSYIKAIIILVLVIIILLVLYDYSIAIKTGNECLNKTIIPNINTNLLKYP